MATREITLKLNAEGDAHRELGKLDKSLGGIDGKMIAIAGGAAAVAAGVAKFVSDGIAAYSEFDSALSEINARTQLTDDELAKVTDTAKQLGIESAFSATDAANAMLDLITSGSDAAEAISIVPDVLDLAAASGRDLATTADDITDIMAQFGLETENSKRIADTLAAAAGSSSANVGDLAAALANGGAVAAGYGLSLEQTSAALAVLAENAIKGSEAGTALKSFLLNANRGTSESEGALTELGFALKAIELGYTEMSDAAYEAIENLPKEELNDIQLSFFNADGSARDFNDVIRDISDGLSLMTDNQANAVLKDLAGSYGQVAARALVAAGGIDDMEAKMGGQNSAAETAEKRLDSFDQKVNLLNSSLEGLFIEVIGPLVEEGLKPLVEWVTEALNSFVLWLGETDAVGQAVSGVGAILGVFLETAQNVFGLVSALISGDFAGAFDQAKALVERAFAFIEGVILSGVGAFLTIMADFYGNMVGGALEGLDTVVKLFQQGFHNIRVFVHGVLVTILTAIENFVNGALSALETLFISALRPFEHGALYEVIRPIVGDEGLQAFIDRGGFGLSVDFTSGLGSLPDYTPTGLGLGDNIRGRISEGLRTTGADLISRGGLAFERAQNVQVTNVNVEIGTNVGDDDALRRQLRRWTQQGLSA